MFSRPRRKVVITMTSFPLTTTLSANDFYFPLTNNHTISNYTVNTTGCTPKTPAAIVYNTSECAVRKIKDTNKVSHFSN